MGEREKDGCNSPFAANQSKCKGCLSPLLIVVKHFPSYKLLHVNVPSHGKHPKWQANCSRKSSHEEKPPCEVTGSK